jgi:GH15 family glucan-1,4-alpha-glucosidase
VTARAEVPIGSYGLIGDTRTAALVAPDGAIDWCCLPRFDSSPVFGRLVGGTAAGHFTIQPAEQATLRRRSYEDATATLETTWTVEGAQVTLRDAMVAEVTGRFLPSTMLVRRVTVWGRPVQVRVHLAPRFGDDRTAPARVATRAGSLIIEYGGLAIAARASTALPPLELDRDVIYEVRPGRPLLLLLSAGFGEPLVLVAPEAAAEEVDRDERGWRTWADDLPSTGHREAEVRSLITLRLLTYSPSGAPVAAPTTSLPEALGGSRNWDYRYAWPRDASIGVAAFLGFGKHREARAFLAWLVHASRLARPRLPALFTLDGRPAGPERSLPGWPGYADSPPVRVGNGAAEQHQLDGYGWVLDAAWLLADAGHRLDGDTWRALSAFADHVASTWHLPDAGIWERRDGPRHHVHSKLMAWLALDRGARIADARSARAARRAARWRTIRNEIGDDLRSNGFDADLGAYTAAYEGTDLDASVLLLPLIGVEPEGSPRTVATIDAIRDRLGAGGPLVYRYLDDDGMSDPEGAFLPCSFWLVQALARIGKHEEAHDLFVQLLEMGGPLGLFAEEMDPATRTHLGNFPQALTHAALLQAALALQTGARS